MIAPLFARLFVRQNALMLGIVLTTLLFALLWYGILYRPARLEVEARSLELLTLQGQILRAERAERTVTTLCQTVFDLEPIRARLPKRLPEREQLAKLLAELRAALAELPDVRVERLSRTANALQKRDLPAGVRAVGLELELEIGFASLYKLLAQLERLNRLSRVETVRLVLDGDASRVDSTSVSQPDPRLRAELMLSAFIYEETDSAHTPLATGVEVSSPCAAVLKGSR